MTRIALIGAGHMATAMVRGFVKTQPAKEFICTNPTRDKLEPLARELGVQWSTDNQAAMAAADIIILAVKPWVIPQVTAELASIEHANKLVISVAAGVSIAKLRRGLQPEVAVLRAMPNIGAEQLLSATTLVASQLTPEQRRQSEQLFQSIGEVVWVADEVQLDAATAIAGSGPAYIFYIMEAMQEAAAQIELPTAVANKLLLQTFRAATALASEAADISELRARVTSPGGTTAAALKVCDEAKLKHTLVQAIKAAFERAQELAKGE